MLVDTNCSQHIFWMRGKGPRSFFFYNWSTWETYKYSLSLPGWKMHNSHWSVWDLPSWTTTCYMCLHSFENCVDCLYFANQYVCERYLCLARGRKEGGGFTGPKVKPQQNLRPRWPPYAPVSLVDRPTQLIHIGIFICCQHTSTKDLAGQSAPCPPRCPYFTSWRCDCEHDDEEENVINHSDIEVKIKIHEVSFREAQK